MQNNITKGQIIGGYLFLLCRDLILSSIMKIRSINNQAHYSHKWRQ